jgi:Raf kinase inhibitor-like YbhB/YbcL family protein
MAVLHSIAALAGKALRKVRAGERKIASSQLAPSLATLTLHSTAFTHGGPIPSKHAAAGGNPSLSPELRWSGVPIGAKELAVLCEDPDAPMPKPFVHWVVYRIPPQVDVLPYALPVVPTTQGLGGALQGKNSMRGFGYTGPKPPPGHGVHRYHFQIFALDAPLHGLGEWVDRDALVQAMKGHILAYGDLVGTYETT